MMKQGELSSARQCSSLPQLNAPRAHPPVHPHLLLQLVLSEAALARLREHEEHCPFHDHEEHQAALRAER